MSRCHGSIPTDIPGFTAPQADIAGTPMEVISPVKEVATTETATVAAKPKKMKKWPDKNRLVNYDTLVKPIKSILERGYRLVRLTTIKGFEYDGHNIGKNELKWIRSPRTRLTEKGLDEEGKRGKSLFDVALNIMFLFGMEQGRRAENTNKKFVDMTMKALEDYRSDNVNLRLKIDTLEATLAIIQAHPYILEAELKRRVLATVKSKRDARIRAARSDIQKDLTRSSFHFSSPERASFKELKKLAEEIDKTTCNSTQWKEVIRDRGWSNKEWNEVCKKKNYTSPFTQAVEPAAKAVAATTNIIEQ
jgi:hypothetical protein